MSESGHPAPDDTLILRAGDIVPADGRVITGAATVDESAITGESAPVVREGVLGRHSVLAGTLVRTGCIGIRALPHPALPDRQDRRGAPWLPAVSLLLGIGLAGLTASWAGPLRALALGSLLPPFLLLEAMAVARRVEGSFWRVMRVLPLRRKALMLAARCNTLLLSTAAIREDGRLSAIEFLPLPGITVREVAVAACAANRDSDGGSEHSIVILAKRWGAAAGESQPREPICGPVADVARLVADRGGSWPKSSSSAEFGVSKRGDTVLAVADGGRPLGWIVLRDASGRPSLDDAVQAGLALSVVGNPKDIGQSVARLSAHGRRFAMAWESGMPERLPPEAGFVLASTAWAASEPTALDLEGNSAKLPAVLLGARLLLRRTTRLMAVAGLTDALRAAFVVPATLLALHATNSRVPTAGTTGPRLLLLGIVATLALVAAYTARG